MAASKPKKSKQTIENVDLLKSEVASFASSLGLAPPPPSSSAAGFDDSDFRKSGPIKPRKTLTPKSSSRADSIDGKNSKEDSDYKLTDGNDRKKKGSVAKPQPKPHPLQMEPFISSSKSPNDKKIPPKLPLMKASLLSGQWYTDAAELESKVLGMEGAKASSLGIEELKGLVAKKKEIAERLTEQYTLDYETSRRRSGDMRLLETTARSGTSTDKVSAFTCLVEDNPIANIRSLDALLSMVTSKVGKRYAFTGFEALKELFIMRLLPDRKLKCLFQRPLVILPETEDGFSLLLMWYWEECLKQRYERFVIALEEAIKDMLPNLKDRAMKTVFILLKSKSEQERRLLSALVNKLGDPERKVASTAGYHLQCLLSVHPNMKAVVIEEVDSFIFRPHIGLRAKYQAVNFLSQILLSKKGDGPKIAKRLVDVYFALFKVLIKGGDNKFMNKNGTSAKNQSKRKKGDNEKATSHFKNSKEEYPLDSHIVMDSRLLSALLTGVNRAFPFVSTDEADDIVEEQTPILFRLVHSDNFNVGVQALMLLYQISSKNQIVSDRFYRSLYSKLLTPVALNFSKPEMFLGLLVKSMKNDISLKRVAAFSKRLLQVALQRPPQYACGCLFLLSEVLKAKPPLWTVVLQDESSDDDLEHFEDIIEDPESDIHPSTNSTKAANSVGPAASNNEEDDDSEFEKSVNKDLRSEIVSKDNGEQAPKLPVGPTLPAGYKPRHREPSYCNADRSSWWELKVLASHVHPSVSTMARTLLSGANIVYNGDPLNDLSLSAFLDKFMEKKPKPNKIVDGKWHGGSQIAPAMKLDMSHHLIGEEILQLAEEDVPAEDVVFHRFYTNKTRSSKKSKKKKKDLSEEMDEDALLPEGLSDEDDEEDIDNILDDSIVPLDDDGNYDYDDLDRVADEDDDDDLLGGGSDIETGSLAEANVPELVTGSGSDEDGSFVMFGDDDGGGDSGEKTKKGKKRKLGGKLGGRSQKSPFASVEEYEHLINESVDSEKKPKSSKKRKVDSEKMPRSPKRKVDSEKEHKSKKKRNALV